MRAIISTCVEELTWDSTLVTFIGEKEYVASSQTRAAVHPLMSEGEKEPSVQICRAESVGEKHEWENILLGLDPRERRGFEAKSPWEI
jgi:hypothetical protein